MNYTASVSDYFKSPKWMMNTLLAGLCVFIPFIGPIVIKGWLITGFWGRDDERCETFPDFDFSNFGKYIERGLWPFLVTLVSGVALGMVLGLFHASDHRVGAVALRQMQQAMLRDVGARELGLEVPELITWEPHIECDHLDHVAVLYSAHEPAHRWDAHPRCVRSRGELGHAQRDGRPCPRRSR